MNRAPPKLRRVAERLLRHETVAGGRAAGNETAAFHVWERLRHGLAALLGTGGVRALLERAVTLAQAEAPALSPVRVKEDGSLDGLSTVEPRSHKGQIGLGEVVLVAHLLGLLVTFIGGALVQSLVLEVWPKAIVDELKS